MTRDLKLMGLVGLMTAVAIGTAGCSSDDGETGTPTGAGGSGATGGTGGTAPTGGNGGGMQYQCSPEEVGCQSEIILAMNYQPETAPGLISNEADGSGFLSIIDATAGGPAFSTDPDAFVYGRFTADGLVKVLIGDEDSLGSMDWDIAFRRFIIRINSGDSGPSCVRRAIAPGADYDSLVFVPDGLTYYDDDYFTAACTIMEDGTGLGTPATALSGFWTYSSNHCLQMTELVYVLELATGQHIKLTVTHYYFPEAQEQCQTAGTVPEDPDPGAANVRIRWAYLP